MIMIVKRDKKKEPLDITKIQKHTSKAVYGLENVSQSELELDAKLHFTENTTTEQIQETLIKTAVDKIDIDRPNWTFVASRLFLYDLYHKVGKTLKGTKGIDYLHLSKYLEYGEVQGKIYKGLKDKFILELLNEEIEPERDLQFNYLGIKTLYDRYLLKDRDGKEFELPQHMFMGIAMFLSIKEENIDSIDKNSIEYKIINALQNKVSKKENKELKIQNYTTEDIPKLIKTFWAKKFYNLISKFEVMLATPTLSNARTYRHQLSSCYIGSTPDNIEGIFDAYKEMALLSKYGGGIGWDWNKIRSIGSAIDNNKGVGGGTIPFLKITNDIALAVDQLGTRKGAIAVYLEPWHIDINDFLDLKKNSGEERRRAHDLFPALWLNDIFMKRIQEDGNWTLFDPYEAKELSDLYGEDFEKRYIELEKDKNIRKEVIKAKVLWKKILTSYFESGSPFLTFKDNANRANPNNHSGLIRSSNLCTEIFQNTEPNKYKIKVKFKDKSEIFFEEQEIVTMDNGVSKPANKITTIDTLYNKEIHFVEKTPELGDTAVCNLASLNLSKVKSVEDMKEKVKIANRMLDNVIDLNFYPTEKVKLTNSKTRAVGMGVMGEAQMLAEAGIEWGSEEHFNKIDELMEAFSYYNILSSAELAEERGSYELFEGSKWSQGVFPIDVVNEETKKLTNRELRYDWEELRGKVKRGMRNGYLMAVAPTSSISILTGTTQAIEPVYKRKWFEENLSGLIPVVVPNLNVENYKYYIPAYELDQKVLIKAGAIRQKWLDQGQSLNIFIRLDKASGKYLNDIYMLGWKLGLKSTYYLRTESPQMKEEDDVVDRKFECAGCQ